MPVGTVGSVKGIHQHELNEDILAQIILGNTYHLYLRPGLDVLKAAGGLHKFMGYDKPMLTDSGGYQVYSLSGRRKIKEEGVTFRSHIDGSKHLFTPENVMDIQRTIGADIIMAFDECTAYPATPEQARESMELSMRWAKRCIDAHGENEAALFGIVQGGMYIDQRLESLERLVEMDFPGYAMGGLSVGEPKDEMAQIVENCVHALPATKPRYLMGVGTCAFSHFRAH